MLPDRERFCFSICVCGAFVYFFFAPVIASVYCAVISASSAEARRNYRKKITKILFMGLTIASLNVRRLIDNVKCRQVFNGLRAKNSLFLPIPAQFKATTNICLHLIVG